MLDSEAPDYRILDTDYSSYAAVYSCDDFLVEKAEIGAVLSRDRMVPESIVSEFCLIFQNYCSAFNKPYLIVRSRRASTRSGGATSP